MVMAVVVVVIVAVVVVVTTVKGSCTAYRGKNEAVRKMTTCSGKSSVGKVQYHTTIYCDTIAYFDIL